MCNDGVAVGSRDFKGTIREPDVYVFPHVSSEILFLPFRLQKAEVLLDPGKL